MRELNSLEFKESKTCYEEDQYLMLSGIQHFCFCKRQWALIHIEQQWAENARTVDGNILHEKADKPFIKEKRKDIIISRAVPISSKKLGLSGIADVIEFHKSEEGIILPRKKGKWKPNIIEYKRGKPKRDNRDIMQLCAQVMCAEEKWNIIIVTASMYYFQTNEKQDISISDELRKQVSDMAKSMHDMYDKRYTPPAEFFKNCTLCSLYDICMPRLTKKKKSVYNYLYGDEE